MSSPAKLPVRNRLAVLEATRARAKEELARACRVAMSGRPVSLTISDGQDGKKYTSHVFSSFCIEAVHLEDKATIIRHPIRWPLPFNAMANECTALVANVMAEVAARQALRAKPAPPRRKKWNL